MGGKAHESNSYIGANEADELRVAVKELNQSIAYLSKMVLQLQRSMGKLDAPSQQEKPDTIH